LPARRVQVRNIASLAEIVTSLVKKKDSVVTNLFCAPYKASTHLFIYLLDYHHHARCSRAGEQLG